jgi:wyosine [tRNA(Phe)-imidazoG37] synthetase (radical SAM superfamily)
MRLVPPSNSISMRTIFGPVPSRRLGRSLGIDVISPKTCTYDCVYCESGRTTDLSIERQLFVPPEQVLGELDRYFQEHPRGADVLTLSSAGEPTLYLGLGDLLKEIKRRFPHLPLVVLTNGSLLWDPQVRKELHLADRVVPSLDAANEEVFHRINRPHHGLELADLIEGIRHFGRDYPGRFHLEIMLVAGLNDDEEQLKALARIAESLDPDRIELNTVVRPPACSGVRGLSHQQMQAAADWFSPERTEIIGEFRRHACGEPGSDLATRILELLRRRPCTSEQMGDSLAVSHEALKERLFELEREGAVRVDVFAGRRFFRLAEPHTP